MNPNPLADTVAFLTKPGWPTLVFVLLFITSIAIAFYAFAAIRDAIIVVRRRFRASPGLFRRLLDAMS